MILPVLVHLPALSGRYRIDPLYIVSGVTDGTWTTNGILPGYPWADGNAGVTTEALGGLAAQDWLSLRLPWWNPYSGAGLPLAAEGQNPAFFLPFVLLLALPHGLLLLRMVLMAVAGLASFALLRRLRLGILPALLGAALYELNGTFAWIAHGPMLPVAFLPLVLLGLERSRDKFSLALVFGTAWSLTAGFPETAFLNLLFASLWAMVRMAQAPRRVTYVRRACLATLAGALLAAPAVLPFLQSLPGEFLGVHDRAIASGFNAANVPLLLLPWIFGAPMSGPITLGLPEAVWVRAGGYCDVVLISLALMGLRRRAPDGAMRIAIAAWIALTALRALGVPGAIWVCNLMPFLRETNVHLYVLPSWSMGCAILTAHAVQDWRKSRVHLRLASAAVVVLSIGAALLAIPPVRELWPSLRAYQALLIIGIAVTLLVVVLLFILMRGTATSTRARVLAAIVIAQAGILFMLPELAGTHGRRVDAGAIRFLQDHQGLGRVASFGAIVPNYGAYYGIAEIDHNYLPLPAAWVGYVRAHLMPGSDGINFYPGVPPDPPALPYALQAYEQAGVSLVAIPHGFWAGGVNAGSPAQLAYAGDVMDVWGLPGATPYFQAAGCTLVPRSRTDLTVNCSGPAVLKRLELDWPGWQASINGLTAAVAADGIFQSLNIPAGTSRVAFFYEPPGNTLIWLLCAAGLCLTATPLLAATVTGLRRPRGVS